LERCSPEECVFSIEAINISDWDITFEYREKTTEEDTENEEFITLNVGENLQIQRVGRCVYFLVTCQLFTGYQYDFQMRMTSADGEIVRYRCEITDLRGEFYFHLFGGCDFIFIQCESIKALCKFLTCYNFLKNGVKN